MNLIQRVINLAIGPFTAPTKEWEVIKAETWTVQGLFMKYAILLAAIPAAAGLLGLLIASLPFKYCLIWAILQYVLSVGATIGIGFIIDALAPTFGAKKDLTASMKLAVFSMTVSWVAGALLIIHQLDFLYFIASIYSLVLMFFGMKILKEPPQDKLIPYIALTVVITAVIFGLVTWLARRIMLSIAFSGYSGYGG
jgi:hypothetical protein